MMASPSAAARYDRPRFRQDLVAELIDEQGARFIDVMDPETGNLFRFYEVEYSLACGMDGERDVSGIVKWAQEELGLTPSPQEVREVIATLGDLGFIDSGAELAPGVVVGAQPRAQPASSLELGTAGSPASTSQPLPRAPDFGLGAPGAGRRSVEASDEVPLGAPGRGARPTPSPPSTSDVSIDLSDHIAVRPADVQEAVRASKVMSAVDVPASLLDTIEDRPARAPQSYERPAEAPRPTERAERSDRIEPKGEIRVGKPPLTRQPQAAKPAVELPRPPAPVDQPAPVPARPASRVSPVLVVLLILVVLGAGAFLVWKYVLEKPAEVGTTAAPPPPAITQPPPEPPPPPPPPTAKIAMEVPEPDDVKSATAAQIETILPDKSAVKTGDVIVKLVGNKPIEAEVAAFTRQQKRLQDEIDAFTRRRDNARAQGNKGAEKAAQAEIDARQKTLLVKQKQASDKTTELSKYLITARNNGTFSPAVKAGQKIAADDVIATIQRDAIPTATFKVGDTRPFAVNATVDLAVGKGELRVTCTITEVQAENATIKATCPVDPALAAATDVTLKGPGAPAPASGTPPPAEPGTPSAEPGTPPATEPGTPPAAPSTGTPGNAPSPASPTRAPSTTPAAPSAPATTAPSTGSAAPSGASGAAPPPSTPPSEAAQPTPAQPTAPK